MDHPWTPLDDREKEREREEDATPCPHIHTQESMQWLLASGHERQERDACTMICYRFLYSSKSDDFLQQPVLGSTRRRLRQTFEPWSASEGRKDTPRPPGPTDLSLFWSDLGLGRWVARSFAKPKRMQGRKMARKREEPR